jgi:hypothetical protein
MPLHIVFPWFFWRIFRWKLMDGKADILTIYQFFAERC